MSKKIEGLNPQNKDNCFKDSCFCLNASLAIGAVAIAFIVSTGIGFALAFGSPKLVKITFEAVKLKDFSKNLLKAQLIFSFTVGGVGAAVATVVIIPIFGIFLCTCKKFSRTSVFMPDEIPFEEKINEDDETIEEKESLTTEQAMELFPKVFKFSKDGKRLEIDNMQNAVAKKATERTEEKNDRKQMKMVLEAFTKGILQMELKDSQKKIRLFLRQFEADFKIKYRFTDTEKEKAFYLKLQEEKLGIASSNGEGITWKRKDFDQEDLNKIYSLYTAEDGFLNIRSQDSQMIGTTYE